MRRTKLGEGRRRGNFLFQIPEQEIDSFKTRTRFRDRPKHQHYHVVIHLVGIGGRIGKVAGKLEPGNFYSTCASQACDDKNKSCVAVRNRYEEVRGERGKGTSVLLSCFGGHTDGGS